MNVTVRQAGVNAAGERHHESLPWRPSDVSSSDLPLRNDELPPQHGVLGHHRRTRPQEVRDQPTNETAEVEHPALVGATPRVRLRRSTGRAILPTVFAGWESCEVRNNCPRASGDPDDRLVRVASYCTSIAPIIPSSACSR